MYNLTDLVDFYISSKSCVSYIIILLLLVIGLELVQTWLEPQAHWIYHGLLACVGTWLFQLLEGSSGRDYRYCTSQISPFPLSSVFLLFVWEQWMAAQRVLWGQPLLDPGPVKVAWCHDLLACNTMDGYSSSLSFFFRSLVDQNVGSPLGIE